MNSNNTPVDKRMEILEKIIVESVFSNEKVVEQLLYKTSGVSKEILRTAIYKVTQEYLQTPRAKTLLSELFPPLPDNVNDWIEQEAEKVYPQKWVIVWGVHHRDQNFSWRETWKAGATSTANLYQSKLDELQEKNTQLERGWDESHAAVVLLEQRERDYQSKLSAAEQRIKELEEKRKTISEGFKVQAGIILEQEERIKELEAWKESALSVMPDMQAIGKAIGVGLGQSVHEKILPAIKRLKDMIRLRDSLIETDNQIIEYIGRLATVPPKHTATAKAQIQPLVDRRNRVIDLMNKEPNEPAGNILE